MKVLLEKIWNEPAAAAGLLAAVLLALGELVIGDGLQVSDLPAILAPLGASGLVRPVVTPTAKLPQD